MKSKALEMKKITAELKELILRLKIILKNGEKKPVNSN